MLDTDAHCWELVLGSYAVTVVVEVFMGTVDKQAEAGALRGRLRAGLLIEELKVGR